MVSKASYNYVIRLSKNVKFFKIFNIFQKFNILKNLIFNYNN